MNEPLPQPSKPVRNPPPAPVPPIPAVTLMQLLRGSGRDELVIVHKTTWDWRSGQIPTLAATPEPLREQAVPWPEPIGDRPPSIMRHSDCVGLRSGVDVLIITHARSATPIGELRVAVIGAGLRHELIVSGERQVLNTSGPRRFSAPQPFTELALRDEWAYGGTDLPAQAAMVAAAKAGMTPDQVRRITAPVEGLCGWSPYTYVRNPHGLGYIVGEDSPLIEGRALPRIERADDRLTPSRLIVPSPVAWLGQPLPAMLTGLGVHAFPRIAMAGLPPMGFRPPQQQAADQRCPEVERGLVPADFCRGSVTTAKPEALSSLMHPELGRSAALGLRAGAVPAGSRIELIGMHPNGPLILLMPTCTVVALLSDPTESKRTNTVPLIPVEIAVDVDAKRLTIISAGRVPVPDPIGPQRFAALQAGLIIRRT